MNELAVKAMKNNNSKNSLIHPTAIIDPSAKIADDVEIGPWTIIGPDVEIGSHTIVGPHVVIKGPTKIGQHNHIFQFASVGEMPQDKKFAGEDSRLEIGDHNVIREACTINRGTQHGGNLTKIGHHNLFMAYVHIAHDCIIGDHCIFANYSALAGHVIIDSYVNLAGYAAVHQFTRVGKYSFIAKSTMVVKDVLPYVMVVGGYDATVCGLNSEGLRRRDFKADTIAALKRAYRVIFREGHTVDQASIKLQEMLNQYPEVALLLEGLEKSARGITR